MQRVLFHPEKPIFFVATQNNIRIYNLAKSQLMKKLLSPMRWISSMHLHPTGDHLVVGSYDRRVCWYDLDLSDKPYKTLKYVTLLCVSIAVRSLSACSLTPGHLYTDITTKLYGL